MSLEAAQMKALLRNLAKLEEVLGRVKPQPPPVPTG